MFHGKKIFSCLGEITSLTFGLCAQNVFEVVVAVADVGEASQPLHTWEGGGVEWTSPLTN